MDHTPASQPAGSTVKMRVSLDLRLVVGLLLAVIIAMLLVWHPWNTSNAKDRTVQIVGEATISAVPDEFVFYPAYQVKGTDKAAAIAELTKRSDEVVAQLKKLGVPSNKIKTDTSGYDVPYHPQEGRVDQAVYTLQLTVTVGSQAEAQKVQDYLVTTAPTGSVSPQAAFSERKLQELESQARNEATKKARSEAEQTARNLGFKVGAVQSVDDRSGFSGNSALPRNGLTASDMTAEKHLAVQPGENEYTYTVYVTFYIR